MSVFRVSVLITLAGKRARMSNGFIFVALGCYLIVGAWAIFLAIRLDKARMEIKKLKQDLLDTIPF